MCLGHATTETLWGNALIQDPVNQASAYMQMPIEAVLEDKSDDEDAKLPAIKKPKTAEVVQRAVLGEPMDVVPPQQATRR